MIPWKPTHHPKALLPSTIIIGSLVGILSSCVPQRADCKQGTRHSESNSKVY
jgi:hypothetical protein